MVTISVPEKAFVLGAVDRFNSIGRNKTSVYYIIKVLSI